MGRSGGSRRVVLGMLLVLAACADEPDSTGSAVTQPPVAEASATTTTTTLATTTTATTGPSSTTSVPPSTSVEPSTIAAPPTTDAPPVGPCALGAPDPDGAVTYVLDGNLLSIDSDGHVRCLVADVTAQPAAWNGTGERLLTADNTIVDADGGRPSGIALGVVDTSWSQPTGTALISIDPVTNHLIWHSSGSDETIDVSFLARTDAAVYHPAGKAIAAVGMSEDGTYGVWLASNRGADRHLITQIDDPSTPATDPVFSADGRSLYFIHRAVHQLILDGLFLNELGVEGRDEHDLVVSTLDDSWAVNTGTCNGSGSIVANGADARTAPGSPFAGVGPALDAVGWLGGGRLVVAARPQGCDGPADVWLWSVAGDQFTQIGSGWDAVSVRAPHGPFVDLPNQIEEAAPG